MATIFNPGEDSASHNTGGFKGTSMDSWVKQPWMLVRQLRMRPELLSRVVFARLNQAAIWSSSITSIPSLNLIPVTTFAR